MSRIISNIIFAGFFLFFIATASAQTSVTMSNDIILSAVPKYPEPHEEVRVSARSFSFDEERAIFVWRVNGVVIDSGTGVSSVQVSVGRIGVPTRISVTADPSDGKTYERSYTIWPTSLDLLWHASTYTPAGYRGKALPVRGATVTVVALPSFAGLNGIINPKTLLYEWQLDGEHLSNKSGRGKSVLSFPISKSKNIPPAVSVLVVDESGTIVQKQSVRIPVFEPSIIFYELHPLRGPLYQSAINESYTLASGREVQLLAVPYFATAKPSLLDFNWRIDSDYLPPDELAPDVLSYRSEFGSEVNQIIALEITNPFYILEHIQESIRFNVK